MATPVRTIERDISDRIADLFAGIEKHDQPVARIVCSPEIASTLKKECLYQSGKVWGADVIISGEIKPGRVYAIDEGMTLVRWAAV